MSDSKQFAHHVYFTLKNPNDENRAALLAGCHQFLGEHPGTVYFAAGTRATEYQREVNDQEFDVALLLVFESEADHDRYQTSDRHQQFLAECSQYWAKVRVFDAFV